MGFSCSFSDVSIRVRTSPTHELRPPLEAFQTQLPHERDGGFTRTSITSSSLSFPIKHKNAAAGVFVGSTFSPRAAGLQVHWLVRQNHYPNGAFNAPSRLEFWGIRVVLD